MRSSLLKSAASNSVINEAKNRFSKENNFPKTDNDIQVFFQQLDGLVPKQAQTQGIGKQMYFWMIKQLMKEPPGFVLGEDDYKMKPLMALYFEKVTKRQLQGDAANLDNYRELEALEDKLNEGKERELGSYTPEQLKIVEEGSTVIYDKGNLKMYKVPKSSDKKHLDAAKVLCLNDLHGVAWCVGRGMAGSYIPQGDFYVIEENGNSKYAISSTSDSLTLWNRRDTPIFSTSNRLWGGGSLSFPSIDEAAKKLGIDFSMDTISSIPPEIMPMLKELIKTDETLKKYIKPEFLDPAKFDKNALAKILHQIQKDGKVAQLSQELTKNYKAPSSYIQAHAITTEAISNAVKMDFSPGFKYFDLYSLTGYLEALAAAGVTQLPDALNTMLEGLADQWANSKY